MNKCSQCDYIFEGDEKVCPQCGKPTERKSQTENNICSSCNAIVESNMLFCPNCGSKIREKKDNISSKVDIKNSVKDVVEKVKDNEFIQSVKQDVGNSQSINMIKNKVKETSNTVKASNFTKNKKFKIAGIIVTVLVVLLIVVTNIHQCEECDKVYFGKKHTISFWGESENVCKDCYDDFYSWDW